ncbi:ABC transporter permease [Phormidium sp. FACHB-1136]|jgi:ABC-2 type transport system permease protein|uniref:ABC transporter permease n=1 Tax=Phormidium sp. FACHB-1136 TaxID=2692848 RepID=UPI0016829534|nr:ABC transporter permease [Phormidium sp. FACHB-1136]MBD2424466.1 ABC transporter permease [Phormidium sp. FACHB-1136]
MSTTLPNRSTALNGSKPLGNDDLQAWKDRQAKADADPGILSGAFVQETLAMARRLFLQLQRRPSTLVAGVIQPLIWLVLFGALFQNVPAGLFGESRNYGQFLGAGILVFTAFGGALNAGLPVMFDREFGFLNRFLVAPLASRYSIVLASAIFIAALSLVQTAAILGLSAVLGAGLPQGLGLVLVLLIVMTLVLGVTALSLGLTFALPGHIELLAVIFVTNLPLLFSSTALVPLDFMPSWLQVVASLNPLTYAIEPIRYIYLHPNWNLGSTVLKTPFWDVSMGLALVVLLAFCGLALGLIQPLLRRRMA